MFNAQKLLRNSLVIRSSSNQIYNSLLFRNFETYVHDSKETNRNTFTAAGQPLGKVRGHGRMSLRLELSTT